MLLILVKPHSQALPSKNKRIEGRAWEQGAISWLYCSGLEKYGCLMRLRRQMYTKKDNSTQEKTCPSEASCSEMDTTLQYVYEVMSKYTSY